MIANPLVSIVMPAYNCEKYITKAINSILEQSYSNLELLIADDASTDNTRNIIDSCDDQRVSVYHNTSNQGYLKTCNKLLDLTKGDLITFQDADDWATTDRLALQVASFKHDPDLGICGTWARYVTEEGKITEIKKHRPLNDKEIKTNILKTNQFCGASIMITRQVYDRIGGYDEFFHRMGNEDYFWSARIVKAYKAKNIDKELYFVRTNPRSVARNIVSVKQLISEEACKYLIKKLFESSFDVIDSKNLEFRVFLANLEAPFLKDSSLIYRKEADIKTYNRDLSGALCSAWKAFKTEPLVLANIKYCISLGFRYLRG